jgi:hypothetical protein
MTLPVIHGIIERRLLVNYRIDPEFVGRLLPAPFRPQLVGGWAVGGICLIRLHSVRPSGIPSWLGLSSENAAHRFAVEWDDGDATRTGVYIPRRDTNSRLNVLAGGRLFPGVHHRAAFEVQESSQRIGLSVDSADRQVRVRLDARRKPAPPGDSLFASPAAAAQFFRSGSLGYSPAREANRCDGLELECADWHLEPLCVTQLESSLFDDRKLFPPGCIEFDSAYLMQNVPHRWHQRGHLTTRPPVDELVENPSPSGRG